MRQRKVASDWVIIAAEEVLCLLLMFCAVPLSRACVLRLPTGGTIPLSERETEHIIKELDLTFPPHKTETVDTL